jgi:hypothetical protein
MRTGSATMDEHPRTKRLDETIVVEVNMTDDKLKEDQQAPPKADDPSPDLQGVLKAITGSDREKGIQLSGEEQGQ